MADLSTLGDYLRRLHSKVEQEATPEAIEASGLAVRDRAKELAPVAEGKRGAGALRDSIVCETEGTTATVGPNDRPLPSGANPAEYGEELEYGQEGKQAQPFMRPALDEAAAPAFVKAMHANLRKA